MTCAAGSSFAVAYAIWVCGATGTAVCFTCGPASCQLACLAATVVQWWRQTTCFFME